MRRLTVILVLLLSVIAAAAQNDSLRLSYSVQGRVCDAHTLRPLESVHVTIPGTHFATVTNADGDYLIKSSEPIRSLLFSYIGYKTALIKPSEGRADVLMKGESTLLDEALVISGDPRQIVKSAVHKINANYSSSDELLGCFYRETLMKRNRYIYISEAVARVFKTPYGTGIGRDRAALDKSRVLMSQRRSDTLCVKIQGGPAQAVNLDLVKNLPLLLNDDELDQYSFTMSDPQYIEGRMHFVIGIAPASVFSENAMYIGTLYIDCERLSFTRMELSLDMYDTMKATRAILVRKPLMLRFTPKELSLVLSYSTRDGVSRLEYLRTTIRFDCDWKRKLFSTNYSAVNELVVTDMRTPVVPISRTEAFRSEDILDDKASEFLDPDFWEDYNIIQPTESLEHAIGRLRKR